MVASRESTGAGEVLEIRDGNRMQLFELRECGKYVSYCEKYLFLLSERL